MAPSRFQDPDSTCARLLPVIYQQAIIRRHRLAADGVEDRHPDGPALEDAAEPRLGGLARLGRGAVDHRALQRRLGRRRRPGLAQGEQGDEQQDQRRRGGGHAVGQQVGAPALQHRIDIGAEEDVDGPGADLREGADAHRALGAEGAGEDAVAAALGDAAHQQARGVDPLPLDDRAGLAHQQRPVSPHHAGEVPEARRRLGIEAGEIGRAERDMDDAREAARGIRAPAADGEGGDAGRAPGEDGADMGAGLRRLPMRPEEVAVGDGDGGVPGPAAGADMPLGIGHPDRDHLAQGLLRRLQEGAGLGRGDAGGIHVPQVVGDPGEDEVGAVQHLRRLLLQDGGGALDRLGPLLQHLGAIPPGGRSEEQGGDDERGGQDHLLHLEYRRGHPHFPPLGIPQPCGTRPEPGGGTRNRRDGTESRWHGVTILNRTRN
ncbi:hypothetical protein [Roseicella sp. DB1501]|uniref:hypothetical protein n=1 Tax=Roseicella sp. DB1501 TaxID=2730925 RepID=UPI001491B8CC|nr:hypothetical protein [Roseicella sp. DB1501]NOG72760.1 hypothetical protein [Roseicella sp. DB1501]